MKISHFSYSDKNYKALKYLFLLKLDCQLFWEHEYYGVKMVWQEFFFCLGGGEKLSIILDKGLDKFSAKILI